MSLVTAAQLQRFAPGCDFMALGQAFDRECVRVAINTPRRIRHFMAQLYVESAGLKRLEESLTYSAARLCEVWPSRFPTIAAAAPYAGKPQALAEKVYGGRLGNNEAGDGWRFRGRGFMQITGRANYGRAEALSGLPLVAQPDLAAVPANAVRLAADYWDLHGINALVDQDAGETGFLATCERLAANEDDDVAQARRAINGGAIGLAEAKAALLRAAAVWPG
jgi:putative chitinase